MTSVNKAKLVHIMFADKFTITLAKELMHLLPNANHHFLILGEFEIEEQHLRQNITQIKTPLSKHFIINSWCLFVAFLKAEKLVFHGLPLMFYALLFPFALKKIVWIIYGGADLYQYPENKSSMRHKFEAKVRSIFLRNVRLHLTHIKGDAEFANKTYRSNANFLYHPVYLSNVVGNLKPFKEINGVSNKKMKILVGNSTDTSNNHLEIFEWLKGMEQIEVYCPLSYGIYETYKNVVKQKGLELFGNRFFPIEHFMAFDVYKDFLNQMDVAIFNHKRQEAMGVTLTLLSLGKEVYVNSATTSFKSFTERGFQLFDNALVSLEQEKIGTRSITANAKLLEQFYSREVWEGQWYKLYQMNINDRNA